MTIHRFAKRFLRLAISLPLAAAGLVAAGNAQAELACDSNTANWPEYTAKVVVFDTPMVFNRLGAQNPNWVMYALKRDVVNINNNSPLTVYGAATPGRVQLRPDKRPRPIALRVPRCSKLTINFHNLLTPAANPVMNLGDLEEKLEGQGLEDVNNNEVGFPFPAVGDNQVKTRFAGVHVSGMQLSVGGGIANDSSNVGTNADSCVGYGDSNTFTFLAEHEGAFKLSNPCAAVGGEATGGNNGVGMFGVVMVQPMGASIYRSQVYEEEFRLAADADLDGLVDAITPQGHPVIDYDARYPTQEPWIAEGKAGLPILNMNDCGLGGCEIVHSEVNAIVAGPNADGTFPPETYPLESVGIRNPTLPNRLEPFRDWMQAWHDEASASDAFEGFFKHPVLSHTLHGVRDSFMINYASGGIGSEIIANRLGVGPMYDCLGCAYEEFFLTSFTVGDPGMRVDIPANFGLENVSPETVAAQNPLLVPLVGPKATTALFQDDPANIHNSYTGDFAKFRNVHNGPKEQHIFHLHNHQWLFNPNDDRANYLDAQGIGPGSTYTYEINFGGSGNRNKTAGDAIFHCHFYPHFAQGMWYHWRIHDVTETGTILDASVNDDLDGNKYHDTPFSLGMSPPALAGDTNAAGLTSIDLMGLPGGARNRAHPDAEILAGVPIAAVVPLPGKPMAPMPGDVVVVTKDSDGDGNADSSQNYVIDRDVNPGYPFWIAGLDCGDANGDFDPSCANAVVGQRPPTPPLDMITQTKAAELLTDDPFYADQLANDTTGRYADAFVNAAGGSDGGLPRHSIGGCKDSQPAVGGVAQVVSCTHAPALHAVGDLFESSETRLDLHKEVLKAKGIIFPEAGTDLEKVAMAAHATRMHASTKINLDGSVVSDGGGGGEEAIAAGGVNEIQAGALTAILAGGNGRAQTRAQGDDVQEIPRNTRNLDPNDVVVSAGDNGVLDTVPNGDDVASATADTTAQGDDVQEIPVGAAVPSATAVVVSAGLNGVIDSAVAAGDVLVTNSVDSVAQVDDVQSPLFNPGDVNVPPDAIIVTAGPNGILETTPAGDNEIVTVGGGGGEAVQFVLNGLPPIPGAPYNDPCVSDTGQALVGGQSFDFFGSGMPGSGAADEFFPGPITAGRAWDMPFTYAAANIQIDAVFNKVGYHYPQQRIIALWGDVMDTINKVRAPEPFVMRLNTFNCAKFQHSNLVPKEFEIDDYQVRTPTDIIGQHIHLPKWDLTTADGAANGWNYEDGTLSPGMVQERIDAINAFNFQHNPGTPDLMAQPHPALGSGVGGEWDGGRVTLQRWFIDPVVDRDGIDRGIGIVFTHDHYGPSTHQQIGLYSTLLVQPAESTWVHNETGVELGTRQANCGDPANGLNCDGGPTSYQAAILPGGWSAAQGEEPFREFYLEFSDFQHAYEAGVYVGAGPDGRPFTGGAGHPSHDVNGINTAFPVTANSFRHAINPSRRQQAICKGPNCPAGGSPFPDIVRYPAVCDLVGSPRPCPEAITADDGGMFVANYRNEPVGLRVFDPFALGPDNQPGTQAAGFGGDLAFALATPPLLDKDLGAIPGTEAGTFRAIPQLNTQPAAGAAGALAVDDAGFYVSNECPGCTVMPTEFPDSENNGSGVPYNMQTALIEGDPYMPLLRTFPGDKVKVKIQAGGHEHEHSTTIHGVKWVQGNSGFGPDRPTGGWRNQQDDGISQQFIFSMPVISDPAAKRPNLFDDRRGADHVYSLNTGQDGWWTGVWGLLRSYTGGSPAGANLYTLPGGFDKAPNVANSRDFNGVCPADAPLREYAVVAVQANEVLDNQLGAAITGNLPEGADAMHVGGPLDAQGGTLVYNPRGGDGANQAAHFKGPLHDPTSLLFVLAGDLEPDPAAGNQGGACSDNPAAPGVANPTCEVRLKPSAPLEPLVLRAAAGDCVEATLHSRLTDQNPDLAGYNTLLQMVLRDRQAAAQVGEPANSVTTFNNNLIRPSSYTGLHAQMVEYDITQHDGVVAGGNVAGGNVVGPIADGKPAVDPFKSVTYRWYAGHLDAKRQGNRIRLSGTPVELGGSNLTPADKVKQGQKAMIGALIVEPEGATWAGSGSSLAVQQVRDRQDGGAGMRDTRADMTITAANGYDVLFEDLVVMKQAGMNHRHRDGAAVPNIASEGQGIPEDSHDAGQKGANFGTEPAWFRFGLPADVAFGNAMTGLGAVDAEKMFANAQAGGQDPWTPVFTAASGQEARVRVLQPTGVGRGSTFDLHGHVWPRDPYLPEDPTCLLAASLSGCGLSSVQIDDANPLSFYLGGQESWTPMSHYEVVVPAGGIDGVTGDYLFRDHAAFGVTDGVWGIMRVE